MTITKYLENTDNEGKTGNPQSFKDFFIVPVGRLYLLYIPLKRKVALIDETLLNSIKNGIPILELTRLLETKDIDILKIENEINPVGSMPSDIVILPTSDCNLRCKYCYSFGGQTKEYLPWNVAKAAIDFSMNTVIKSGRKRFHLGLFGGGEPTLNWNVVTNTINYTRKKAKSKRLSLQTDIVTNGMYNKEKALWLANNFDWMVLSFDGPKEIQNRNRPLANGGPSYDTVYNSAKVFDKAGVEWYIRSTVTGQFVDQMPEIVEFFIDNFNNFKLISFEPVQQTGRCKDGTCPPPSQEDFVKYFIEARKIGRKNGLHVRYTAANLERLSVRFCGASGKYFIVNPDCSITACNEIDSMKKEFSDIFVYGKFNNTNSFDIDMGKVENLRKRNLTNMNGCEGCFAKYQCCGGCPIRSLRTTGNIFNPYFGNCYIVREVLKEELLYLLSSKKELNTISKKDVIEEESAKC